MNPPSSGDEFVGQLPLPLAQLYRRACNAKSPQDRHHHAFYLAEATLKLAACLRVGITLGAGLEPRSPLAQDLEALCLPSVGHWVGFLRDTTEHLRQRPDAALLPLAGHHESLLRADALPAVRALARRAAQAGPDDAPPVPPEVAREAQRQGVLGFFNLLAAYRNQVFGHGAQRLPAFYEELGPLLLEAAAEVLRQECLFGGLTLVVARLAADDGRSVRLVWQGLRGLGSFVLPAEAVGPEPAPSGPVAPAAAGQVAFVGPGVRVSLHPLVVYQEDRSERERVGFLNRTATRRRDGGEEVRRCEYLDYATGDTLREVDARRELTLLLARLRGQAVSEAEVDRAGRTGEEGAADEAVPPAAPQVGLVIGDFEVAGELGRGGMGIVYKARQRSLNRWVALKVLPPALAADTVALARFRREIAALARCEHPNLVKILTSGSDGDRHYYAMELVEGTNLNDLMGVLLAWRSRSGRPLRASHLPAAVSTSVDCRSQIADCRLEELEARSSDLQSMPPPDLSGGRDLFHRLAELFADAADALVHLHARGVLHRDLKPANLMLTADGKRLVIMDLGLAQLKDRSHGLTRTDTRWVGTLRYCSPEQLQWNLLDVDERADVYGLGATLYELVALAPLFDADSEARLIEQVLRRAPRDPRALDPAVPRDLAAIALGCLDKDRTHRYASAGELAADLRRFCAGQPVRVRPASLPQRFVRWCRRNPVVAGLTAAVALALVAGTVVSTYFAVLAGERAGQAVASADEEKKARQDADGKRRQAERLAAEVCLQRGLALADQGDVAAAALWLARGLKAAPSDEPEPQQILRLHLAGFSWQLPRLRGVVSSTRLDDPTGRGSGEERAAQVSSALSPDGRTLAVFRPEPARRVQNPDWSVRLWDLISGRPRVPALEHEDFVNEMVFRPDGKVLATATAGRVVRFWDTATGALIGMPWRPDRFVRDLTFSPDSKRLLLGRDDGMLLWDVTAGKQVGKVLLAQSLDPRPSFAPDGRLLLTFARARNEANLWEAATGRRAAKPIKVVGEVHRGKLNAGGTRLLLIHSSGSNDLSRVWLVKVPEGEPVGEGLALPGGVNLSTSFSPDGKVLLVVSGEEARLVDTETGKLLGGPLRYPDEELWGAAFSSDSRVFAFGSSSRLVRVCDRVSRRLAWPPFAQPSAVQSVHFSPDGNRLTVGCWNEEVVWDLPGTEQPPEFLAHPGAVKAVGFGQNGRTVVSVSEAERGGLIRVWDRVTRTARDVRLAAQGPVLEGALAPDGVTLRARLGNDVVLGWAVKSGAPRGKALTFAFDIGRDNFAFSPDGNTVAVSDGREARLWSLTTGGPVGAPLHHEEGIPSLAFSPDGRALALFGPLRKEARLWSVPGGHLLATLSANANSLDRLAFSPDGKTVVTAGTAAQLWDAATGKWRGASMKHSGIVRAIVFSPDGKRLLTGCIDNTTRLWDAGTGAPFGPLMPHTSRIESIAFRPDGSLVAVGCADGTVRLWATATSKPWGPTLRHDGPVTSLSFSPDGRSLLVGSGWQHGERPRGEARLWPLPGPPPGDPERITRELESRTGMELDPSGVGRALGATSWHQRHDR